MNGFQASRLIKARAAKGWTQQQLADAAQMDQGAIARLERGRTKKPLARTIQALADALEVTVDDLCDAASAPVEPTVNNVDYSLMGRLLAKAVRQGGNVPGWTETDHQRAAQLAVKYGIDEATLTLLESGRVVEARRVPGEGPLPERRPVQDISFEDGPSWGRELLDEIRRAVNA